ncbi:MAG: OsmC family protein [Candidatus Jordarchaeum sp.]|uniref:OsmC family protein n=1 Tax=Candidatus Jordarchaeum sp. TaxID=2823881 RepID=UPI00404B6757
MLFEVTAKWSGEGYEGKVEYTNGISMEFCAMPPWGKREDLVTPESCFVAAIAMCYEMFMVATLKRMRIEASMMEVKAVGEIAEGEMAPGKAFDRIELTPRVKVSEENKEKAVRATELAKEYCLITNSLKVPVTISPEILT